MTGIDIGVLIFTILLLGSIIFFKWVLPKLQGKKSTSCSDCPIRMDKKIKRSLKSAKKEINKEHKN